MLEPIFCCDLLPGLAVGRKYHRIEQRKNWTEALDYCRAHYTDLLSIRSLEEHTLTSPLFNEDEPRWIGLYNNMRSTAGWKWINGDVFNFTHWHIKVPGDYMESVICVTVRNGQWFGDDCSKTYLFTCYKEDREYYRIDQQKSWSEARDYCQDYHTDLISIGNPEEQSLMSKLFDGDTPLWIGLYNTNGSADGWKWINGDSFDYIETPNRIYYRIDRWKNWTDALFYCRKHYTDLTSVQNQQEHEMIFPLFDSNTSTWIGLYNDKQSSDGWRWTNGDKLNYSQWRNKMSHNKSSWLNSRDVT
uniref:C-type lectin domain-containing protein n=1 Tax=Callorhinchus milii TaxID=7868 RepID=A0A4W3IPE4_CALMI